MNDSSRKSSDSASSKPWTGSLRRRFFRAPGERRAVVVIDTFAMGGAERQAVVLADALRALGVRTEVWALRREKSEPVKAFGKELGVRCRTLGRERLSPFLLKLHARRFRPDYLIAYSNPPNRILAHWWQRLPVRAFLWSQCDEGSAGAAPAMLESAALTRNFLANSVRGATYLRDTLGVPAERVRVVANGAFLSPPRRTPADWRAALAVDAATPVVTMVANLRRAKDHATVLRAWRRVLDASPSPVPVLVFAGRGDDTHESLVALAADLDLRRHVRFLGPVADVAGLLAVTDVFVHSSPSEGLPNSVLEAMLARLPVVASDIAAHRAMLPPASLERLFPVGDAEALATELLRLLGDRMARELLGRKNREWVDRHYSTERLARETLRAMDA